MAKKENKPLSQRKEVLDCVEDALRYQDDSKNIGRESESSREKHEGEMEAIEHQEGVENRRRASKHEGLAKLQGLQNPDQASRTLKAMKDYLASHPDGEHETLHHKNILDSLEAGISIRSRRDAQAKKKVPSREAHIEGQKKRGDGLHK